MKRSLLVIGIMALVSLMQGSCGKNYEEFFFVGHPVGAEICSVKTMGYLIEIDYPKDLGDTITAYGQHFKNAVMGYRSPRLLQDGETLYGVAYRQDGFASLNCVGVFNYTVPEVVLVSVDEDSARVMSNLLHETE